ncbi:unnamed protein product [Lepeophtheirus salmonis]|uniref:(salmon louse) hypothetical protein n=1 Tax=Lepeophtheirus salmonis TaxID=72036 RepID=A0A7R8CW70_LEPSM|nr:unnamed protein product [Lepeophtheirus salmonis]CAF2919446.1 unnamed protein product [Lepeophtheirus salmonis]
MLDTTDHYSFRLSSDESLKGTLSSTFSNGRRPPSSTSSSSSKLKIDQMFNESRITSVPPKVHQIKMKFQSPKDTIGSVPASRGIPDRDTPFSEARSAVQKQNPENEGVGGVVIKHTSHGVSHDFPSLEPLSHSPPPPIHYGVSDALKSIRPLSTARSGSVDSIRISESSSLLHTHSSLEQKHQKSRLSSPNLSTGESLLSITEKKKEFVKHKVDYLGALPVPSKSTSLSSLQKPLKDLYFKYRAMKNLGQTNLPGVQEIFNSFSTIAVWAAVKFMHKRDVVRGSGQIRHSFAFLPLISDPEGRDKASLFNDIEDQEVELASDTPHPPLFACVMRRNGAPKQLECHGFVCSEAEDAITIAANLYQALLKTMKKRADPNNGVKPSVKKASVPSSASKNLPIPHRETLQWLISEVYKRGANGRRSGKLSNRASLDRRSSRRKRKPTMPSNVSLTGKGDVYTRVAIPRSKSFMNVTSQYNLQELFKELKEKEGVESIDDVLKKIISPDGISFNEIKPVYRELLLKLAMTMTQDEIFQRSKNIISQKKSTKSQNNNHSSGSGPSKNDGILGSFFNKKNKNGEETDISNPIPITGKYSNSSTQTRPVKSAPLPPVPQSKLLEDEAYSCCGGCGTDYETVDYSDCSCISSSSPLVNAKKCSNVGTLASSSSSSSSISSTIVSCNCDYGSCDSNDKCYCTLSRNSNNRKKKKLNRLRGVWLRLLIQKWVLNVIFMLLFPATTHLLGVQAFPVNDYHILTTNASHPTKSSCVQQWIRKETSYTREPSHENNKIQPKDRSKLKERDANSKMNIISMKKSAEIAAVFSGAKINQTTDIFNGTEGEEDDKDSTDDAYDSMKNGSHSEQACRHPHDRSVPHQFSEANLKHALGYFP